MRVNHIPGKNAAEKRESQLQNKRDRLTTLRVSSEAENGEPQPQNKRGKIKQTLFIILEEKNI